MFLSGMISDSILLGSTSEGPLRNVPSPIDAEANSQVMSCGHCTRAVSGQRNQICVHTLQSIRGSIVGIFAAVGLQGLIVKYR